MTEDEFDTLLRFAMIKYAEEHADEFYKLHLLMHPNSPTAEQVAQFRKKLDQACTELQANQT